MQVRAGRSVGLVGLPVWPCGGTIFCVILISPEPGNTSIRSSTGIISTSGEVGCETGRGDSPNRPPAERRTHIGPHHILGAGDWGQSPLPRTARRGITELLRFVDDPRIVVQY